MIDDGNDVRQALAGSGASCEDVVPAGSRPANRISLVLIESKCFAFAFVLTCPKNPRAFGMQDCLGNQIIDRARVLKRRVELDQRVRPEAALIKTGGDKRIDALVSNSDEASDI
jgi:hypothetical protein